MQIGNAKKVDPLTRIQEEIKEVARREQELRELFGNATSTAAGGSKIKTLTESYSNSTNDDLVVSTQIPSLASFESVDENHSDDSGVISASSSPVNGVSANHQQKNVVQLPTTNKSSNSSINNGYIRSNRYISAPVPPPQKIITRTVSTPHIFTPSRRTIQFGVGNKGLMQRFIETRGKIALKNNNNNEMNNPQNDNPITTKNEILQNSSLEVPTYTQRSPVVIGRDNDGNPIYRRGYIPVEVKIQKELRDLKNRESELKKIRKIRQSSPDLLDSIENEALESDDDDGEIEHCYGPGKLRSAKSISELCDSMHSNNISTRTTPSPVQYNRGTGGLRPAVSLAQLCDLDPEEVPSSHQLIARFENLIQQNS